MGIWVGHKIKLDNGRVYRVTERDHGVGGASKIESLHLTYLDALLYLRDRSYGGLRLKGRNVEIREDRVLVKVYTGTSRPSADEFRSAVLHPERSRSFRVGPEVEI